jgi:mono/diheme cytochrome c family protein
VRPRFLLLCSIAVLLTVSLAVAHNDSPRVLKTAFSDYTELAKAPKKARSRCNPLEKDPEAIAAGMNLFQQHCAECHGRGGQGAKKGPSLRVPQVQDSPPGAIFWLLTNGVVRRGMPVWSKLPEPQRWQLVSYIKSLGIVPANPVASSPGH